MTVVDKLPRRDTAPALSRLLAECAVSRAALGACRIPLALVQRGARSQPLSYVNSAFEGFFGYREGEALGRSLAALVLRGDEALGQRMLEESSKRWEVSAWAKDGSLRHVEVDASALRDASGEVTHWVVVFSDRDEVAKLRAEVESLKSLAAAGLGVRLDSLGEPARGAQQPGIEVLPADELHADRQASGIL